MATLTVQSTPISGDASITFASAAGGGDVFSNNGRTFLAINNASGSQITVTFVTPRTVDGLSVADAAVTVDNNKIGIAGPFDPATFNNSSNQVAVSYSGVSSVTVAAFQ